MTAPAFPLLNRISVAKLTLSENKASFESLFTRSRQVITIGAGTADRWQGFVTTAPLVAADVATLFAFLTKVGRFGQFLIGDPDYAGPASGATTGLVQGGGQAGMSLVVDGVATAATILKNGEYFQVGAEFKKVTQDCVSSGGTVTLVFVPALRASPADNATVTFAGPVATVALTSEASKETDNMGMGQFTVSFEEVI